MNLIQKLGLVSHSIQNNWVIVSCPLGHPRGDRNPSAGFSINPEGKSVFHCFACGTRPIESILNTLKWKKGIDCFEEYFRNECFDETAPPEFNDPFLRQVESDPVPVPQAIFDLFEPVKKARDYLQKRGISTKIAEQHGLLYLRKYTTPKNRTWKNAIVCPIRDLDYQTYWIHFRSIDSKHFWHGKPEHFNSDTKWGRNDSWFGIEFLDINKPVFLVEGIVDCLRLKTLGIENVIAAHGGIGNKSDKVKRLIDMQPRIIYTGFDADEPGNKFKEVIKKQFDGPILDLDWSKVGAKDPGDLKSKEDLRIVLKTQTENFKFRDKWEERI